MQILAEVAGQVVTLLDLSGRSVMRLLGFGQPASNLVTEEEIGAWWPRPKPPACSSRRSIG